MTEIELKAALEGEGEAERVRSVLGRPLERVMQANVYLDTADGAWAARRWGVRVRSTGGPEVVLTVKGPASAVGDFVSRGEWELALPATAWAVLSAGGSALEGALARLAAERAAPLPPDLSRSLSPQGWIETERESYALPGDEGLTVELDRSRYPDGSVVHEVELEIPDAGREAAARACLEAVLAAAGVPYRPSRTSKLARLRQVVAASKG